MVRIVIKKNIIVLININQANISLEKLNCTNISQRFMSYFLCAFHLVLYNNSELSEVCNILFNYMWLSLSWLQSSSSLINEIWKK